MVVVLVIAILLAIAIPSFLGARKRSQDTVARSSLAIAVRAVTTASYTSVNAAGLAVVEPSLTYVASPSASTGPKIVSVAVSGSFWGGAAMSSSGTCLLIRTSELGGQQYGTTSGACTGDAALGATGSGWSSASNVVAAAGSSAYAAMILSLNGLSGYWRLDETAGTTATDLGPHGYNGTYSTGVQLAWPGALAHADGTSARFAGSFVTLPAMNVNWSDGLTFAAWALPEGSGFYERIFELGNGEANDNLWFGRLAGYDQVAYEVRPPSSPLLAVGGPNGSLTSGGWQFLVVTQSPGGQVVIYRNGVPVSSMNYVRSIPNVNRTVNYIGNTSWNNEPTFTGRIDEVAMFNRPLTSTEVAALYATAVT
jgi:type IV pilus assembly protein PilA